MRDTYLDLYASNHDVGRARTAYQGLELWKSLIVIDVGEKLVLTYDVVTSPQATEPLAVRVTPLALNGIRPCQMLLRYIRNGWGAMSCRLQAENRSCQS